MKSIKWAIALLVLALVAGSGAAWADYGRHQRHGHHHGGHYRGDVYLGLAVGSALGAWWYAMPRHTYQTVVVEREVAPTYVERAAPPPPPTYWYYCEAARGYYPYVGQCPGGWMRVVPQTPGQP